MHGGFLVVLFASSVWHQVPVLIAVSGTAMLIEWWVQRICGSASTEAGVGYRRQRRIVNRST